MKPRNYREARAIMCIRRKERKIQHVIDRGGNESTPIVVSLRSQVADSVKKIESGYYLESDNFRLDHSEELEREDALREYSLQTEDC